MNVLTDAYNNISLDQYYAFQGYVGHKICQITAQHVLPILSKVNLHLPGIKALSTIGLCSSVVLQPALEEFVKKETVIAWEGVMANIGADGERARSAAPGVVIASPSTYDPDYVYTWTRDSALVFKMLIDQFISAEDNSLEPLIQDFIASQKSLQYVDNPSGSLHTGGLGEPKFYVNLTAFEEPWGRPQRDGPPLRATAMITYAKSLLVRGKTTYLRDNIYLTLKHDLDYVANKWNRTTFDLWEEVSGSSYFTTAVQHRALREGAKLFTVLEETDSADLYTEQANNLLCFAQSYWNEDQYFMTANTDGGRSGIDANTVLASIHNFDPDAGCDPVTFQPCSDRALSNLRVYVDSFRSEYSINEGVDGTRAVATGRYKEDIYYGGNPWYLTMTAVSEQLYYALNIWNHQGYLSVTNTSLHFFQQFHSNITLGLYAASTAEFVTLTLGVRDFADDFLRVIANYTPDDGSLAEQFGRDDAVPISAKDLTWSYAAILTAFNAKMGKIPPSSKWGAKGLKVTSCDSNLGETIEVVFNVNANNTVLGEQIFVTGSDAALGNWSPEAALPLSPEYYPLWSVSAKLPVGLKVEYKYIRKDKIAGSIIWEADPNNLLFTKPSETPIFLNDVWK